jgi:hypothetical protein
MMMFNIQTEKHGKTYKGEIESIKKKIVKARDRGICDNEGRTIEKKGADGRGLGPIASPGKGDRNRSKHTMDWSFLPVKLNVWERDDNGNLVD